jgi:hypothetical protein
MAKQIINLGTMADNKSGDPLRTAFQKVNENFTELYARPVNGATEISQLDPNDGVYILDVTKEIQVLTHVMGAWQLPDAPEGTKLTFVPANGASKRAIWIVVANVRYWAYDEANQTLTTSTVGQNYYINPFITYNDNDTTSSTQAKTMVSAVFVNGAWSFEDGVFD